VSQTLGSHFDGRSRTVVQEGKEGQKVNGKTIGGGEHGRIEGGGSNQKRKVATFTSPRLPPYKQTQRNGWSRHSSNIVNGPTTGRAENKGDTGTKRRPNATISRQVDVKRKERLNVRNATRTRALVVTRQALPRNEGEVETLGRVGSYEGVDSRGGVKKRRCPRIKRGKSVKRAKNKKAAGGRGQNATKLV